MDKQMSQNEMKRAQVLDLLRERKISQQETSKRRGVSTRQVRRLAKRYLAEGLSGLVSKKRGRAIEFIGAHYRDFGPTLACEKLAEVKSKICCKFSFIRTHVR